MLSKGKRMEHPQGVSHTLLNTLHQHVLKIETSQYTQIQKFTNETSQSTVLQEAGN